MMATPLPSIDAGELMAALDRPGAPGLVRLNGDAGAVLAAAAARGLRVGEVDLSGCAGIADALAEFGRALAFPAWYGHNLDALADCLGDFGIAPATGGCVLVRGLAALVARDADATVLTEVLAETCAARRDDEAPLSVLCVDATEPTA